MQWNRASHCEYDGKSVEIETTTWSEFPNGGKAIVKQILASEERNNSKRAGLWESQSRDLSKQFSLCSRWPKKLNLLINFSD